MPITIPISMPDCDNEANKNINGMRSAGYALVALFWREEGSVALQRAERQISIVLYMENTIKRRPEIYRGLIAGG
jgi:hypothetical protein